ncbi:MAG: proline--tRNA ligase [Deltaproteobacteria bacterium]|nr:proline--tRNA ligase [Deltaproteobacteria bacterium]
MAESITTRAKDFAQWYQDVIRQGDLAENAEVVRGCMVIKPHGYAIWEKIQADLDRRFKATGHKNAYFPLLIPKSFLAKEAQHVDGFAMECAVVTHSGLRAVKDASGKVSIEVKNKLEEEYVIRPTSETIIGHFFAKWIQSYRNLPLLINQWANVMRWEMRTRLFLRTTEFLWQEGHTAHADHEDSLREVHRMLDVYADFAENVMAMPVIRGKKTNSEKFAGALDSFCIEAMMQDGKALQAGTSHDLGQNFGRAFDVKFQSKEGREEFVWQTSWGVSTRLVGGLIMTHSDDAGLVLPPKLAPIHVAIVPIFKSDDDKARVLEACVKVRDAAVAVGLVCELDDRDDMRPGSKHYEWEQKGVPVRIELGPRDVDGGVCVVKRRDRDPKEKTSVAIEGIGAVLTGLMDEIQKGLYERALAFRKAHTVRADTYDELKTALDGDGKIGNFVLAHWDGTAETEAKIKEETKATIRCIPFEHDGETGVCVLTGKPSAQRVIFARAY